MSKLAQPTEFSEHFRIFSQKHVLEILSFYKYLVGISLESLLSDSVDLGRWSGDLFFTTLWPTQWGSVCLMII